MQKTTIEDPIPIQSVYWAMGSSAPLPITPAISFSGFANALYTGKNENIKYKHTTIPEIITAPSNGFLSIFISSPTKESYFMF